MLFTEPIFLFLFLPALLAVYFVSPPRLRNLELLAASLVFYFFGEKAYFGVLLVSILVNYSCGLMIERAEGSRRRALAVGVVGDLLLLGAFKYADFLAANVNVALSALGARALPLPHVHLPIGISFFTFMGISYLVDVYRRQLRAQADFTNFALYITLFPHLIAGPIVRYGDIAAEIVSRRTTRADLVAGFTRFTRGFGKKMLVANALAVPADRIFDAEVFRLTPALAWLGALCYALQLYYDFSGYTDMAIGLARLFGFHFPENFNFPYVSTSITEFWKRWHISLSTWFRDYLFFPLGVRRPAWRLYVNLLVVFLLCGLWHGASWSFVVWGLWHGIFLVLERAWLLRRLGRAPAPLRHAYALLVVTIGWVFFRAKTLAQALAYLGAMLGFAPHATPAVEPRYFLSAELCLALAVGVVGSLPVFAWLWRRVEVARARFDVAGSRLFVGGFRILRVAAVVSVFVASAALSAAGTYNPFIYFRF